MKKYVILILILSNLNSCLTFQDPEYFIHGVGIYTHDTDIKYNELKDLTDFYLNYYSNEYFINSNETYQTFKQITYIHFITNPEYWESIRKVHYSNFDKEVIILGYYKTLDKAIYVNHYFLDCVAKSSYYHEITHHMKNELYSDIDADHRDILDWLFVDEIRLIATDRFCDD